MYYYKEIYIPLWNINVKHLNNKLELFLSIINLTLLHLSIFLWIIHVPIPKIPEKVSILVVHLHIPLTTLVWVLILWIQMARRNRSRELSHIFSMGDVPNNFGAIFLCKVTTDKCWGDLFVVFAYPSMLNDWIHFSYISNIHIHFKI